MASIPLSSNVVMVLILLLLVHSLLLYPLCVWGGGGKGVLSSGFVIYSSFLCNFKFVNHLSEEERTDSFTSFNSKHVPLCICILCLFLMRHELFYYL